MYVKSVRQTRASGEHWEAFLPRLYNTSSQTPKDRLSSSRRQCPIDNLEGEGEAVSEKYCSVVFRIQRAQSENSKYVLFYYEGCFWFCQNSSNINQWKSFKCTPFPQLWTCRRWTDLTLQDTVCMSKITQLSKLTYLLSTYGGWISPLSMEWKL